MVLEAFLLIQMGFSGTLSGTETYKSLLFREDNQANSADIQYLFPVEKVEKSFCILTESSNSPDSIIKSDTNKILKVTANDSIALTVSVVPVKKFNIKRLVETELPNTQTINEIATPEFILNPNVKSSGNNMLLNSDIPVRNKKLKSGTEIFLTNETIVPQNKIEPGIKKSTLQDWFTLVLVSTIVLLAWIRSFFGRYFQQSIQSLYDYTLSTRVFKNKNVLLPRISFLLLINFIIISSLFAFKSLEIINLSTFKSSFSGFLLLNTLFLGLISFRYITFHGLNLLFPRNQSIMEYYYQVQNYYKSIGLIIFPILILEAYYPTENSKFFLWSGAIAIGLLYLYRIIRGQRIVKRLNLRLSYLVLYIISFEVLPISICFKVFSRII